MDGCELIRETLSAYLDGELTQQESQKVAVHLRGCPACREIYDDFCKLRAGIRELDFPSPSDEQWSSVMGNLAFKTTRGVGWLLWIGGGLILVAYGIYELIRDPTIDAVERIGVLALILGAVLVFLTVLIERMGAIKTDKYKDIEK